jgi:hypothetical protein
MELIFMLPVILTEGRKDSEALRFLDHDESRAFAEMPLPLEPCRQVLGQFERNRRHDRRVKRPSLLRNTGFNSRALFHLFSFQHFPYAVHYP